MILLANKIDDPSQDVARARVPPARPRRPVPALRRCTATAPATCSTRSSSGSRARRRAAIGDEAIRVAILGRPNVGKSSLLNALVGEERVIVSDVPGTTRDTIDTVLERDDRTFVLVDTAGLRRKRKQRQGIEYYSELRALEAAERADVALVLIDASEGIVEQDLAVADVARKAQCSTLVVLSKWDIDDRHRGGARPPRPAAAAAAADRRRLGEDRPRRQPRLLGKTAELYDKHAGRIQTAELNRFLGELREARQPPSKGTPAEPALRRAGHIAPAALPLHRQRPAPRHARLRLLGREPAARAVRARGGAGGDRLQGALVNVIVVGGGAWGTAFAHLLRERGHEVTLASRDARRDAVRRGGTRATSSCSRVADRRSSAEVIGHVSRCRPRAGAQPRQGPRPGDRRAALDARAGAAGRRALGAEHGGGGGRRPAGRDRDRVRGRGTRALACRTRSTRSSSASTSTPT